MIVCLCLLLIIFLVVAGKSKNIYSVSLATGILAIWVLLFALVLYISKMSAYNPLLGFEKTIYLLIKKMSISYFDITTLVNVAISIMMVSHTLLFLYDLELSKCRTLKVICVFGVVCICSLMLFILNNNRIYEKIYIYSNIGENLQNALLMEKVITVSNYTILGMCVITYIKLAYQALTTRIIQTKRKLAVILTGMALIEVMFLCVLFLSPVVSFFSNFNIYDFKKLTAEEQSFCTYLSVLIVFSVGIMLIIANKNYGFGNKKGKEIDKNNILVRDIRHVFHNYKNALYTISLLADEAIETYGSDEAETALVRIKDNVSEYAKKANRFLDIYNNVYTNYKEFPVSEVIASVVKKIAVPENTELKVLCNDENAVIYGSVDEIEDMLINIIINACEAVEKSGTDRGLVVLEAFAEKKWICISIKDNGIGMDRKTRRNIFTPLFSTKRTFNNWGIGLSYAKSVAEAHGGDIGVKSAIGKGTEFQITLLRERV